MEVDPRGYVGIEGTYTADDWSKFPRGLVYFYEAVKGWDSMVSVCEYSLEE